MSLTRSGADPRPLRSAPSVGTRWSFYAAPVFAIGLTLVAFAWLVTQGTGRLFDAEPFGQLYDAQADSLRHGQWDVPPAAVGFEAFVYNGKTYTYFGFVPALARAPLNAMFPSMWGRWTRLSLLLGCLATLVFTWLILLETRADDSNRRPTTAMGGWAFSAFLLCAGLGTTLIFLGSRAYVYHEAIVWGAALSLGCYWNVLRYLRRRSWPALAGACACCFLAFFCRASVGSGTVAALSLLALVGYLQLRRGQDSMPLAHLGALAGTVLAVVGVFVAVNHSKFGTWFDGMPFRFYNQVAGDPVRMARTHGKAVSLANLRTDSGAYLALDSIQFAPYFPWVFCQSGARIFRESHFDVVERFSSVTASMPALFCLSLLGLGAMIGAGKGRRPLIPILGALAAGMTVLMSAGISERYLHDFVPLLVLAGAVGLHHVVAQRARWVRRSLLGAGVALVAFSIYANVAFAIINQRAVVWGVPTAPRQQFATWQRNIDHFFGVAHPAPAHDNAPPTLRRMPVKG